MNTVHFIIIPIFCKPGSMKSVNESLVIELVKSQFPQFEGEVISAIEPGGWDNRSFRLGDRYLVRLPSHAAYEPQVEKEHRWLPVLAPFLPVKVPKPLLIGQPTETFPRKWSIYEWIEGETLTDEIDKKAVAQELAEFLRALQQIDTQDGPSPGQHCFYRGGDLSVYDSEVREVFSKFTDRQLIIEIWEQALSTQWNKDPVWVHGDMSRGNVLAREGVIHAVIDFGLLNVGDPACDLAIAWTYFDRDSRFVFKEQLGLDEDTWIRGMGWALWKALIEDQTQVIEEILCSRSLH